MTVPGVYSPEQAALQAHVDKVIASDGMDESRAVEVMARAIWISSSGGQFASWESLDVFTRGGLKQDARAALGALRALEGE